MLATLLLFKSFRINEFVLGVPHKTRWQSWMSLSDTWFAWRTIGAPRISDRQRKRKCSASILAHLSLADPSGEPSGNTTAKRDLNPSSIGPWRNGFLRSESTGRSPMVRHMETFSQWRIGTGQPERRTTTHCRPRWRRVLPKDLPTRHRLHGASRSIWDNLARSVPRAISYRIRMTWGEAAASPLTTSRRYWQLALSTTYPWAEVRLFRQATVTSTTSRETGRSRAMRICLCRSNPRQSIRG